MGFNPFSNAFGLYCVGEGIPVNEQMCSDVIGFVYNTYFLASKYDKSDVLDPGLCTSLLVKVRLCSMITENLGSLDTLNHLITSNR